MHGFAVPLQNAAGAGSSAFLHLYDDHLLPGFRTNSSDLGVLACRVVLKRVNVDREGGGRSDFLKSGTMAKGSAETGKVESYMNSKLRRYLSVRKYVAKYLGSFINDTMAGGIGGFSKVLRKRALTCIRQDRPNFVRTGLAKAELPPF